MKSGKRIATIAITLVNALLWSVPLGMNSLLVHDQYAHGYGSYFLLAIVIVPYAAFFLIAVLGPIILMRSRREDAALILAGVMLGLWLPIALVWAMGMGST